MREEEKRRAEGKVSFHGGGRGGNTGRQGVSMTLNRKNGKRECREGGRRGEVCWSSPHRWWVFKHFSRLNTQLEICSHTTSR